MLKAVLCLRAAAIAGVLSFVPLFGATAASMEDAIVVYGGVGNLGRDAQPCLAMLYETGGKKFLPYTDKINNNIRKALSGITLFPEKKSVIVGADQLYAAIKKSGIEFDSRPSQMQIKEFLEDNEGNIFALSIVGGSELYIKYTQRQTVGVRNFERLVVAVSAILTQISGDNAGQVVLAGTYRFEGGAINPEYLAQGEVGCENPDTITDKWLSIVATAYTKAAVGAINVLAKQKQTADEDTTSVIVMGVTFKSKVFKDLFRTTETDLKSVKSICEIPLPCADDDKVCKGIIGSIAFSLTEIFSKRGFLAIPPLNWGAWGKSGQYQVAKNLKMTGGRSEILPFVQINVGSNAADRKIHSTFTKLLEKDMPIKNKKSVANRYYGSWMKHRWEETEFDKCESVDERGDYPETKGFYKFLRVLKHGDVKIGRRRFSAAAALFKSVYALEKKLEVD